MTQSSIARCTGGYDGGALHRHSHTDETLFARPGESLPHRKEAGGWYPLAQDNIPIKDAKAILMGNGPIWISSGPMVENGQEINVLCAIGDEMRGGKPREGRYRVIITRPVKWHDRDGVHVDIEHVGDMDPTKLVYLAGLATC
ncbi:MAG: hypothetical protein Athens041674_99 [Parcubacteria group bacterium Athens0416_74]|nr:MAG: hypothetical protein Athens041674_99 [Parcubacteria group bacterium Athens0416_74]